MSTARKLSRVNEYKFGPEPEGIRYCMKCNGEIQPGQLWLKEWAPNQEYAVGRHWGCLPHKMERNDQKGMRECALCGHFSRDEREAALHFRFGHRITKPVGAVAPLK